MALAFNPSGPMVNRRVFDRFSVVHAAVGALFAVSKIPAPIAIGAQILFELFENDVKLRVRNIWPDPTPDGIENSVGDVASFVAGYYGARAVSGTKSGGAGITILSAIAAAIWVNSLLPKKAG